MIEKYLFNEWRRILFKQFEDVKMQLVEYPNLKQIFIFGSFISKKKKSEYPNDIDVVLQVKGKTKKNKYNLGNVSVIIVGDDNKGKRYLKFWFDGQRADYGTIPIKVY